MSAALTLGNRRGGCGCGGASGAGSRCTCASGASATADRRSVYAAIKASMLEQIAAPPPQVLEAFRSDRPGAVDGGWPLRALRTRRDDDPVIALLDAWACVAEVLELYTTLHSTEASIRSATERWSLVQLARLIGYVPRPGVAAEAFLAFRSDDAPGAPERVIVPVGTKIQSVPAAAGTGEKAQTFESVEPLTARPQLNAVPVRQRVPSRPVPGATSIVLRGAALELRRGDAVLFVNEAVSPRPWTVRRIVESSVDHRADRTTISWRDGLPELGEVDAVTLHVFRTRAGLFGHSAADWRGLIDVVKAEVLGVRSPEELLDGERLEWPEYTCLAPLEPPVRDESVPRERPIMPTVESVAAAVISAIEAEATAQTHRASAMAARAAIDAAQAVAGAVNLANKTGEAVAQVAGAAAKGVQDLATGAIENGADAIKGLQSLVSQITGALASTNPAAAVGNVVGNAFKSGAGKAVEELSDGLDPIAAAAMSATSGPIAEFNTLVESITTLGGDANEVAKRTVVAAAASGSAAALVAAIRALAGDPEMTVDTLASEVGTAAALAPDLAQVAAVATMVGVGAAAGMGAGVVGLGALGAGAGGLAIVGAGGAGVVAATGGMALLPLLAGAAAAPAGGAAIGTSIGFMIADEARGGGQVISAAALHALQEAMAIRRIQLSPMRGPWRRHPQEIDLDAQYASIVPESWIVLETPSGDQLFTVMKTATRGRADYQLSGKVTRVTLGGTSLVPATVPVRSTVVLAESEVLVPADEPLTTPLAETDVIEFDRIVEGFTVSQTIVVEERDERARRTLRAEAAVIADVRQAEGASQERVTRLRLTAPLRHSYDRARTSVLGNVVRATHGETVHEVLGQPEQGRAHQAFALKQGPLTFVSAPNEFGAASTLVVRSGDASWTEVPALFDRASSDRVFVTRPDGQPDAAVGGSDASADAARVLIRFGDGLEGALPPATAPLRATYRKGLGAGGNVGANALSQLLSQPLGITGARNPLAASGGADGEPPDSLRENAPRSVQTLGRVVSVEDYGAFAAGFAGIGMARSIWTELATPAGPRFGVAVVVADPEGRALDLAGSTATRLREALYAAGDPTVRFELRTEDLS